jgi:RHS repeat-associated protein
VTPSFSYRYDSLDRRERRVTTDSSGAQPEVTTTDFGYVGSSERLSRDVSVTDTQAAKRRAYDYDSSLERLGLSTQSGAGAVTFRAYVTDADGDVEALEESDGRTLGRYGYDPYGGRKDPDQSDLEESEREAGDQIAADNPFRFQGFFLDEESESYDMGARDYVPGLGRFLTPDRFEDPIHDLGLQLNPVTSSRYAFLGGNPVDQLEYDGHVIPRSPSGGSPTPTPKRDTGTSAPSPSAPPSSEGGGGLGELGTRHK